MTPLSSTLYLLLLVAAFAGIVWWAFGARRKKRFEKNGDIPFDEPD